MDKFKKEELIEKIAHSLDITPQMYNESISVIRGITHYLISQIPNLEIFKQGSFKLGTVIRPYNKDKDGEYDVDLVVKFQKDKDKISPSQLKQVLRACLKSEHYEKLLDDEKRRCWTLHIPSRTTPFHVDLLPCIKESDNIIQNLSPIELRGSSVAITNIKDKDSKPYTYEWLTSNPKGFSQWFDSVNYKAYKEVKIRDRERIFNQNPDIFGSVEEVSDEYTRSPLQKVIQILKRHRDVMFFDNKEVAPISIIITTLVGKIVEENSSVFNTTYDLLNFVIDGLNFYSQLTISGYTTDFDERFKNKKLITKHMKDGKPYWQIQNPANSKENLANKWNEHPEKIESFFKWVKQVKVDLIDILDQTPAEIQAKLKYCLGEEFGNSLFENFSFESINASNTRVLNFNNQTPKPYRG